MPINPLVQYVTRLGFFLVAFFIFPSPAWTASVTQHTEGSCSPAVADVKGNVSITCEGVDPVLLDEIVKLLNEILRDTRKLDQIRQDLDKTSKRTDQIEDRLADRKLTDVQIKTIANTIKLFAGQEFDITTFWDLKEPLAIANRIYSALKLSGWKHIKPESGRFLMGGVAGVQVYVHAQAEERTKLAADFLVLALTKEGIAAEVKKENTPHFPNNKVQINVGTKSDRF